MMRTVLFLLFLGYSVVVSSQEIKDNNIGAFPELTYKLKFLAQNFLLENDYLDRILRSLHRVSCAPSSALPVGYFKSCQLDDRCQYSFDRCNDYCNFNHCTCNVIDGVLYRDDIEVTTDCKQFCGPVLVRCVHPLGYITNQSSFLCKPRRVAYVPDLLCQDYSHFRYLIIEYLRIIVESR